MTDRWALGIAVGVVLVSLIWWRSQFLTTILWRRLRLLLSRRPIEGAFAEIRGTGTDVVATVLLRVDSRQGELPLGLLTGYLDRYGWCAMPFASPPARLRIRPRRGSV